MPRATLPRLFAASLAALALAVAAFARPEPPSVRAAGELRARAHELEARLERIERRAAELAEERR